MPLEAIAIVCAGLFSGAAIYINAVEHPARLASGVHAALNQWRPSYKRATLMQASLGAIGFISALAAWILNKDVFYLVAALLLGSVIPFTLLVILPTNKQLMDPVIEKDQERIELLLRKWNRLHLVRSIASTISFVIMLTRVVQR